MKHQSHRAEQRNLRFLSLFLCMLLCCTLLPAVSALAAGVEISDQVEVSSSGVFVRWTDSGDNGPYRVAYQYADGESEQDFYWAGGSEYDSTTKRDFFLISDMIPGHNYNIKVKDKNGAVATKTVYIPSLGYFIDGKLEDNSMTVTIDPRFKTARDVSDRNAKKLNNFNAAEMMRNLRDGYEYGLYYKIKYPSLAYDRTYTMLMAMFAPDDFVVTVAKGTLDLENRYSWIYWDFVGENFFTRLYDLKGFIPTGTYRIEMYWDGMLVNRKEFKIK